MRGVLPYTGSMRGVLPYTGSVHHVMARKACCVHIPPDTASFCWKSRRRWWRPQLRPSLYASLHGLRQAAADSMPQCLPLLALPQPRTLLLAVLLAAVQAEGKVQGG